MRKSLFIARKVEVSAGEEFLVVENAVVTKIGRKKVSGRWCITLDEG